MSYKIQLTWHEARKCWKKHYRGKTFYLGKGKCSGRSDIDGYRAAWHEWTELKRFIDTRRSNHPQSPPLTGADLSAAVAFATDYRGLDFTPAVLEPAKLGELRIDELIKTFVKQKRALTDTGTISHSMYDQYRCKLEDFCGYAVNAGKYRVNDIDAAMLSGYQQLQSHLTTRKDAHAISPWTAKKRLDAVRQFMEWLYEFEVIDRMPRNLNRHFVSIRLPKPSPLFFTPDEVRAIYNAASDRTKLYVALAANCGYTQIDIASLEHGMIDWSTGIVNRTRHKTETLQVHKLWPITLDLLKAHRTPGDSGLLLVDANGQPLSRSWISDEGKVSNADTIKHAFDRVMNKLDMTNDRRRFKVFRKTSSNEIERAYPEYPHLTSDFLAHSEQATKRFYVGKHFDKLFAAIDHLQGFYRLAS